MIRFEEFLSHGKVFRREKDLFLKESLIASAFERMLEVQKKNMSFSLQFENSYESLRQLADALLAAERYKTYSHEAAISFLYANRLIDEIELEQINLCRKIRHDSKYYGKTIANLNQELLNVMQRIFKKIYQKLKQKPF